MSLITLSTSHLTLHIFLTSAILGGSVGRSILLMIIWQNADTPVFFQLPSSGWDHYIRWVRYLFYYSGILFLQKSGSLFCNLFRFVMYEIYIRYNQDTLQLPKGWCSSGHHVLSLTWVETSQPTFFFHEKNEYDKFKKIYLSRFLSMLWKMMHHIEFKCNNIFLTHRYLNLYLFAGPCSPLL